MGGFMEKRTSLLDNGLIWFGAAVSIAEILTGMYLAPLGMETGLITIFLGHIIGCSILFLAGVIGGKQRLSSMESARVSFGSKGSLIFAVLNIIQLLGWTAIMIYDGALSMNGIINSGAWIWCIAIGIMILIWVLLGIKNIGKLNFVVMAFLMITTLFISKTIFFDNGVAVAFEGYMSFGAAMELSIAMPLSWMPLISDYTREAEEPVKASAVSAASYGAISCWMFIVGMGAAIYTGATDIASMMILTGMGAVGLVVVLLSTTTTTFLDAYSVGVSGEAIQSRVKAKYLSVAAIVVGTVSAILFQMDDITEFLYLIGSVFSPMFAVMVADYFLLKNDSSASSFDPIAIVAWLVGLAAYRWMMTMDLVVGYSLPSIFVTVAVCIVLRKTQSWLKSRIE